MPTIVECPPAREKGGMPPCAAAFRETVVGGYEVFERNAMPCRRRRPEGTQMLAKVRGWQCKWPVVVWSMKLCLRKDLEQVLESHKPGRTFTCDSSGSSHHMLNTHAPLNRLHWREHSRPSLLKAFSSFHGCLTGCALALAWNDASA